MVLVKYEFNVDFTKFNAGFVAYSLVKIRGKKMYDIFMPEVMFITQNEVMLNQKESRKVNVSS